MEAWVTVGAGFLLAVLWFDLMFDVQVRTDQPAAVESIARYYRRVTTDASPMNYLVAFAMLATLTAIVVQLAKDASWGAWVSLPLALGPMMLARIRTVPNAVRLGQDQDPLPVQLALAHRVLRDHIACFVSIAALIVVQLTINA